MIRPIIAAILVAAAPVIASFAGEYHTVTWFADHPADRADVLKLCREALGWRGKIRTASTRRRLARFRWSAN